MGAGGSVPELEVYTDEAALAAGYTPEQISTYKTSMNLKKSEDSFEEPEEEDPDMDVAPPELPPEFFEKQELLKQRQAASTATFQLEDKVVGVDELVKTSEKFHILDARTLDEIAVSRIPGAHTTASFYGHPKDFLDKPLVVYSTVGYTAGGFARELINEGYENIKTLGDGGLLGYTLYQTAHGAKEPLVKPDGTPTNQVHTFSPDLAELAGEGMECTYFKDPTSVLDMTNRRIRRVLHGWGDFNELDEEDESSNKAGLDEEDAAPGRFKRPWKV